MFNKKGGIKYYWFIYTVNIYWAASMCKCVCQVQEMPREMYMMAAAPILMEFMGIGEDQH